MGKVIKYTGSKMLGEELRRLRGVRSLADITQLSRESPLATRVQLISAPGLSQLENGISMPTSEMLYSLSVLYNVSPVRLLHIIVEEKLTRSTADLPSSSVATRARLQAELSRGNWYDALALAIHGGRMAEGESDRVAWSVRRAVAMRKLGMRQDAISLLLECSESRHVKADERYIVHGYLAEALIECGYARSAHDQAARAEAAIPEAIAAEARPRVLKTRIYIASLLKDFEPDTPDETAREGLRWIAELRRDRPDEPIDSVLRLDIREAALLSHLGNSLVASRKLAETARKASEAGLEYLEMAAYLNLGILHRAANRLKEALRALERAEVRAVRMRQYDAAFECYFELSETCSALGDERSSAYLRRCWRYWPLVQARTPRVLQFEERVREGLRP